MGNRLAQFEELIAKKAKQYGLDPTVVRAVIMQESRGNPGAVSPAGAQGLMQLMPGTAKDLGVKNSLDPEQNLDGGVRYLKQQIDKFGLEKGLAAYNAGPGNVIKHGGVPPFKETQNYVTNIMKSLGRGASAFSEIAGTTSPDFSGLKNLLLAKQFSDQRRNEIEESPESKLKQLAKELSPEENLLNTIEGQNKKITDGLPPKKQAFGDYVRSLNEEQTNALMAGPQNVDTPIIPQSASNFLGKTIAPGIFPFLPPKEASRALGLDSLANIREGVDSSLAGNISGMSTPKAIVTQAALLTPAAPYVLAAMTPFAAKGAYDSGVQSYNQFSEGDIKGGTENLLNSALNASMAIGGGIGAYKGIKGDYAKLPSWAKDETGAIKIRQDTPPVPERPETLQLQIESLAQGRNKAVLVTPGAALPEVPQGFKILDSKVGTWIYDPAKLKPFEIKKAVAKDTYGELLGYVEPKSTNTLLSVAAIKDGVEAKAAMASPQNLNKQMEVFQKQFPEAEVKVAGLEGALQVVQNRLEGGGKERGFVTTVKESPMSPKQIAENVSGNYDPINNPDTMARAQSIVKSDPILAKDRLLSTKNPSAVDYAIGFELIRINNAKKDFNTSIDIAEQIATKATFQGQAMQALSMYDKLGPDGILVFAKRTFQKAIDELPPARQKVLEKTVDQISKDYKLPKDKALAAAAQKLGLPSLTPEFAAKITEQARTIQEMPEGRAKAEATALMLRDIAEQVPPSVGRKLSTFQAIAQLLNPKTGIRNVLGNAAFTVAENIKDLVALPIDSGVSLITGQRSKSLSGFNQIPEQVSGFFRGLKQGANEAIKGIELKSIGEKWDVAGVSNGLPRGRTFKKGLLGGAEKVMNVMLRAPDRAFYEAAKSKSLAEQMSISKIKAPTPEMLAKAEIEALYKTFQDDSAPAKVFSGIKNALNINKDFGAGDILIKYPKTPGNLLDRSIEYSPGGFIKSISEIARAATNRGFDQKNFVDSTSRAIIGTAGLTAVGYKLAELGLLRNTSPRDPDLRAIEKSAGLTQSQLNLSGLTRFILSGFNPKEAELKPGDKLVTYDWALPLSIPVSMGARAKEKATTLSNSEKGKDYLATAAAGFEGGLETLGDQPLIKTFTNLARGNTLPQSIIEASKGIPASFTPTLIKQFNDLIDNTSRDTKDSNPLKMAANMAIAKTPFARALPAKIDPFGNKIEKYQDGTNSIMNVFFNPSFVSEYKTNPETKMVLDLYKNTSDARIVPIVIEDKFKFNGIPIELNARQKNNLQEWVGVRVKSHFSQLAKNKEFLSLPDEEKVKVLSGFLTTVRAAGRAGVFQDMLKKQPEHLRQGYAAKIFQDNKLGEDQIKNIFKNMQMFNYMNQ
ncbi:MAG: lytic transglycosylase domain-containing protein [Oligoflexales bacterium]|nr:lytic transglycosylase domain-containing protein [Oligoflexales bacterium]